MVTTLLLAFLKYDINVYFQIPLTLHTAFLSYTLLLHIVELLHTTVMKCHDIFYYVLFTDVMGVLIVSDHGSRLIVHNSYNKFFFAHHLHVMHAYIKGPEERLLEQYVNRTVMNVIINLILD